MLELEQFVEDLDDLGSEVILNLGSLAAYRYPPQLLFEHLHLMQMTQQKLGWAKQVEATVLNASINRETQELGSVVNDPDRNRQREKEIFLRDYVQAFFKLGSTKPRTFRHHMSQAPQLFFILNMMLRECYFTQELMQQLLDYTKVFMAQPLPHSIVSLETNRVILNE